MNKFTERCINKRVDSIVEDYNFKNRRKTHPDECPCNSSGPCHDIKNLNCFFCYCPGYNTNIKEGGCNFGNPQSRGFYFDRSEYNLNDIWDCSDCTYPHQGRFVKNYLRKLFRGELIEEQASAEN